MALESAYVLFDDLMFEEHLADTLKCEPWPFVELIEGLCGKHYRPYSLNANDAMVGVGLCQPIIVARRQAALV